MIAMMSLITRFGKIPRLRLVSQMRRARSAPNRRLESPPNFREVRLTMLPEWRNPMRDRPSPCTVVLDHRMAVAKVDRLLRAELPRRDLSYRYRCH